VGAEQSAATGSVARLSAIAIRRSRRVALLLFRGLRELVPELRQIEPLGARARRQGALRPPKARQSTPSKLLGRFHRPQSPLLRLLAYKRGEPQMVPGTSTISVGLRVRVNFE